MITVGFTYDLRDDYLALGFSEEESAEFDSRETIDFVTQALEANGYRVEPIGNIKALAAALVAGKRWDLVFNLCEGVKGIGREAQVPALLEAFDVPFVFSSSDIMVLTMNKALAKHVIREAGIPTPSFAVLETVADVQRLDLRFPVFAKPLAEGTGKGISGKSLIQDKAALQQICGEIIDKFKQPALVETYLPGRDLTVGMLGSGPTARVVAVLETLYKEGAEPGSQSYFNKENCEKVLEYVVINDGVAEAAAEIALRSWRALGCVDGGRVDLRCDAQGIPNFLEVNPMAGLHPTHSDLPILAAQVGMNHTQLIGEIMQEALSRYGLKAPKKVSSVGV